PGRLCGRRCCVKGEICCDGACRHVASDPHNCGACGHACPKGAACVNGQCQCRHGFVPCGDTCVSPRSFATDPRNCGACGHDCTISANDGGVGATAICVAGVCACPPGTGCSGDAVCHGIDQTVSTAGICCSYPQRAECCTESAPGKGDGFAH